jgi:hypothetical protein
MKYLVTRVNHDGTVAHDLFDDEFIAKTFKEKFVTAYLMVVCKFKYENDWFYYTQNDEGDVCIVTDKFEYVTDFKPKNKLCVEFAEIIKNLENAIQKEDRERMH